MMKFLFIVPGDSLEYRAWRHPLWQGKRLAPLDVLSIVSYLDSKGHDVKLLDCDAALSTYMTEDVVTVACATADYYKPDVVGIRMYTAEFDSAAAIARALKAQRPGIPIVGGGPHPSLEPQDTFHRIEELDALCIGPGEEVCLEIAEGRSWKDIPGLMLRNDPDGYRPRLTPRDIDDYPFPNYDLLDVGFYVDWSLDTVEGFLCTGLSAVATRGCPHSCKFCASKWTKPYRMHSPEYVVAMTRDLSRYHPQWIYFLDSSIANSRRWLEEVCEGFMREGLFHPRGRMLWKAFIRADQVGQDLLRIMKAAGCGNLFVGMESGTDRMLREMDKGSSLAEIEQAVRYVEEAGIVPSGNYVLGFPTETEGEILKTLESMQRINVNRLGITYFKPLPGSPFYYEMLENGVLKKDDLNWTNLGNHMAPPEKSLCEVPLERLVDLFHQGADLAYSRQYSCAFEHHAFAIPRSTAWEITESAPDRGLRVLLSRDAGIEAVPYDRWRWSWRYYRNRGKCRVPDRPKPAEPRSDPKERRHVSRIVRESAAKHTQNVTVVATLLSEVGRNLVKSFHLVIYRKRLWPRPLAIRGKWIRLSPTTRRDHVASPYLAIVSSDQRAVRIRVRYTFAGPCPDSALLITYVQDEEFSTLADMVCDPVDVQARGEVFTAIRQLPEHVRQFRLVLYSDSEAPVRIPDGIDVEQVQ